MASGHFASFLCLCRLLERHHQGGHKDAEAGHHVAWGFPPGGPDHEETQARQTGASIRGCVWGAHLHCHRIHVQRYLKPGWQSVEKLQTAIFMSFYPPENKTPQLFYVGWHYRGLFLTKIRASGLSLQIIQAQTRSHDFRLSTAESDLCLKISLKEKLKIYECFIYNMLRRLSPWMSLVVLWSVKLKTAAVWWEGL